jgi:hypothetical protein
MACHLKRGWEQRRPIAVHFGFRFGLWGGACPSLKPCDQNILKTLHLVDEMIALADQGDVDREDVGCGVLYGMLRDTAYKLKRMAEEEKRSHQEKGWWPLEG